MSENKETCDKCTHNKICRYACYISGYKCPEQILTFNPIDNIDVLLEIKDIIINEDYGNNFMHLHTDALQSSAEELDYLRLENSRIRELLNEKDSK